MLAAVVAWLATTLYLAAALLLQGRAHTLPPWPDPQLLRQPWLRATLRLLSTLPVILTCFMSAQAARWDRPSAGSV